MTNDLNDDVSTLDSETKLKKLEAKTESGKKNIPKLDTSHLSLSPELASNNENSESTEEEIP